MFRFVCKTLLHPRNGYSTVSLHNSSSMEVSLSLIRYFSCNAHNPHSFTLSYLTQTCGLSPESALSASKTVRFESSEQPDSVLSCFHKFGLSKTDISEMIKRYPKVLCCNPEKTISPKVEFFLSRGVSTPDLARILFINPKIFKTSLGNRIVPTFDILIEVFHSDDKAIQVIKRNPFVLNSSSEDGGLITNINILRESGVSTSNIFRLICTHWRCVESTTLKLRKTVEELKEMGFDPLKWQFVQGIMVLIGASESKRVTIGEVYKKWGWSDKDVKTAFKKYPTCMAISEDNIMGTMDFYVNKLGLDSSFIVNYPTLLGYSLKKRLIPRGAVIEFLSSKGLVELDSRITNVFRYTEKCFLEKYVNCHEDAPHLIKLYNEKFNFTDTMKSGKDEE